MPLNLPSRDEVIAALRQSLGSDNWLDQQLRATTEAALEQITNMTADEFAQMFADMSAEMAAQLQAIQPTFAELLAQRQGSKPPNFDELYRRKAELDRRLLEGDSSESK